MKKPLSKEQIIQNLPKDFPNEFISDMLSWKEIIKSPYSHSYYDAEVGWDFKPDGSLRISDHWNFFSKGKLHCQTTEECKNNSCWTLARYDASIKKYIVIKSIQKEKAGITLKNKIEILAMKRLRSIEKISKSFTSDRMKKKSLDGLELNYLNSYFKMLEKYG